MNRNLTLVAWASFGALATLIILAYLRFWLIYVPPLALARNLNWIWFGFSLVWAVLVVILRVINRRYINWSLLKSFILIGLSSLLFGWGMICVTLGMGALGASASKGRPKDVCYQVVKSPEEGKRFISLAIKDVATGQTFKFINFKSRLVLPNLSEGDFVTIHGKLSAFGLSVTEFIRSKNCVLIEP